jgi:DNA-directed RNA polymerase subunit beta'
MGLKENVIIGKLIPAGTGMSRYKNIDIYTDEDQAQEVTSIDEIEEKQPSLQA